MVSEEVHLLLSEFFLMACVLAGHHQQRPDVVFLADSLFHAENLFGNLFTKQRLKQLGEQTAVRHCSNCRSACSSLSPCAFALTTQPRDLGLEAILGAPIVSQRLGP